MKRKPLWIWLRNAAFVIVAIAQIPVVGGYLSLREDPRLSPVYRFHVGVYRIASFFDQSQSMIARRSLEKVFLVQREQVEYFFDEETPEFQRKIRKILEIDSIYNWDVGLDAFGRFRVAINRFNADRFEGYVERLRSEGDIDVELENQRYRQWVVAAEIAEELSRVPKLVGQYDLDEVKRVESMVQESLINASK